MSNFAIRTKRSDLGTHEGVDAEQALDALAASETNGATDSYSKFCSLITGKDPNDWTEDPHEFATGDYHLLVRRVD